MSLAGVRFYVLKFSFDLILLHLHLNLLKIKSDLTSILALRFRNIQAAPFPFDKKSVFSSLRHF